MRDDNIQTNSIKAWFLAARPKTLSGAAVPIMLASALALSDYGMEIRLLPLVLCFLFAFVMQIDANFVNDYFDFKRGNDDDSRLGPKRACAQGWITERAMLYGILITTAVACVIGLPLILYGGWSMLVVGALCVLFCFLYTTHLSYIGMGDLLVLLFFGFVPVVVSYYLISPANAGLPSLDVWFIAFSCGLVIDTLLIVNNYRDIDNDRRSNKKTLVVRMGKRLSETVYLLLGFTAYIINVCVFAPNHLLVLILPVIYLVLHTTTYRSLVKISKGRELNKVLGMTARNIFLFGLLTAVSLLF